MISDETQVAVTLSRLTKLLLNEKLIEDDDTLHSSISSVLQKYVKSSSPIKKPKPANRLTHISKMLENAKKNKEKLEMIRRKLDQSQEDQIKKIPTIDKNSKKICSNITKSLIERSEIDLKIRNEKLQKSREQKKHQENENFKKSCSFSPLTLTKTSRHPGEVVRDLYEWKGGIESKLKKSQEENEKSKMREVYPVPKINKTKSYAKNHFSKNPSRLDESNSASNAVSRKESLMKSSSNILPTQKFDSKNYSYEEIVKMLSCNTSFS